MVPKGALEGKKYTLKNMHLPMLEKGFPAHMRLHCDLDHMGCTRLMTSPSNLVGNNRIITKIIGKMEL